MYAGCGDVDLSGHDPKSIVSSYTYGVVNGSEATVVCEEGYDLFPDGLEKMTLRCINKQWYEVKTNKDGSEETELSWRVLCYPSQRK